MPFDGIATKCMVDELTRLLAGGRVEKVFQPEADEVVMNIRAWNNNYKLVLSASANYPRIHLTEAAKENPAQPPVFCMLLRKHLAGGKILGLEFYDYERVIGLLIESANELGDISAKKLVIEIMGRHSNIILINSENRIIDAIKHIDSDISSVREVMPARPYLPPPAQDKTSVENLDPAGFMEAAAISQAAAEKFLLEKIKGFSPLICREACNRSGIDGRLPASSLDKKQVESLLEFIRELRYKIDSGIYSPCISYEDEALEKPLDFYCLEVSQYRYVRPMKTLNEALELFYSSRDRAERLKQRKADLTKVLGNAADRCSRKLSIQQQALRDVADRDRLKLFGELITANIYCMPENAKSVSLLNYYSEKGDSVEIPLDENLKPQENAQRYFRKYSKAKSTFENTSRQIEETRRELDYLESVSQMLDNCNTLQEIDEVREELAEQGFMVRRKKVAVKRKAALSEPLRFKSSDGLEILVGKNNRQNDLLTLKTASSNDIWLHTKNIPGSHVIIRKTGKEIPESALKEAALLAAWHSKARMSSNVPVDYTAVKNVNKPSGAKPGMVIYVNYKTISVTPDEKSVNALKP